MFRPLTITALIATTTAITAPAMACDMHGGGFGFGNPNANWQSYSPRTSTTDPAFLGQSDDEAYLITPVPAEKPRPSFSNAANRASLIAKARHAKKIKEDKSKPAEEKPIKKAALVLDADR